MALSLARIKRLISSNRRAIAFVLTIFFAILLLANLLKLAARHAKWLAENKDAVGAANSIFGIIVLLLGAIFSYYRFFRGRTLAERAEPSIDISVHGTSEDFNIHAVVIRIKNVGSTTIWEPVPIVAVSILGPDKFKGTQVIDNWKEQDLFKDDVYRVTVIESGETVSFSMYQHIPKEVWAVAYSASISSRSKHIWAVSKTVSNAVDLK